MRILLLVLSSVLLAAPAHALGFFGELITPGQPGHRATLDAKVDFSPTSIRLNDWSVETDTQMGSGWISSGEWVSWTHTFEPGLGGAELEDAWLFVTVGDYDLHREMAEFHLGGELWKTRSFRIFDFAGGNVLSAVTDNELLVAVRSGHGSFKVGGSLFKAKYDNGTPPIPEPHAVLAFGLGGAIVALAIRRRSSHS